MIGSRWIQVLGPLSLAAALVGCSTSSSGPESTEKEDVAVEDEALHKDDTAVQKAPDAKLGKHDRHDFAGMRGGPLQMLRQAVDGLGLTAEQKATIDKAFDDAKPTKPGPEAGNMEAYKAFFAEVGKQIRANSIDEAGLLAKASGLEKPAVDPMRASMAKALQTVHDALTPEQRVKLASDLDGKLGAMKSFGDKAEKFGKGKGGKPGLGFLLRGVDVSDEQKDAIEKALTAAGLDKSHDDMKKVGEEMESKMKALLEAFKGEKFDAAAMMPAPPAMKGDHLETMIKSLKIVVPLLDEAQRNELADRIEKGGDMKGKRGPRGEKGKRHGKLEQE